jgi:hypothetical protein
MFLWIKWKLDNPIFITRSKSVTDPAIGSQLALWDEAQLPPKKSENPRNFHTHWHCPARLPDCVTTSPTVLRHRALLGPLAWDEFPERNLTRFYGQVSIPYATLAAATLVRLQEGLHSTHQLLTFLEEHPGLIWLLGFPLHVAPKQPFGFNARASLPTERHWNQMLRDLPNAALQFLLADSVRLIRAELAARRVPPLECVSLDTKHILAWVKENNPKAYITDRYNKARQPRGDPDCRLGCKRRRNQSNATTTPTRNPVPASTHSVGEFYWGYGSGIVVTKVPGYGEFVLAELTQPFDQGDVTYFFPLMQQVEQRLRYKPRYGTFDAAFDAWYVYAYFHDESEPPHGFAVVPFSEKGGFKVNARHFSAEGLPLCQAGLAMPLQFTFNDRTSCLVEHERGKYVCPLVFPQRTRRSCPIQHPRWQKGGCTAMMPTSIGARLRYTLDRQSEEYKNLYNQRTAVERINSQAVALGIERPHLRNGRAIANQNTLIYTLINLRFLQRLQQGEREEP